MIIVTVDIKDSHVHDGYFVIFVNIVTVLTQRKYTVDSLAEEIILVMYRNYINERDNSSKSRHASNNDYYYYNNILLFSFVVTQRITISDV